MKFIDPKTDFAFKKIFGSDQSKEILLSFLNALLYEGAAIIEDLEIIDPYLAAKIFGAKDSYLDVKAKLNNGTNVIIEMQVINVQAFGKRVIYNAAKTYSLQLRKGEVYQGLRPVIALTITAFEMFENHPPLISRFVFKEKQHLFDYPNNEIELVFIELPKFNKELEQLETLTEKWIYFVKNSGSLETVPENMGIVPEIRQAFEIANEANLTLEEWEAIDKQMIWIGDRQGALTLATTQGFKKGLAQGLERGLAQGLERARQQRELALILRQLVRRVGSVTPDIEAPLRGLSTEQLENLGEAVLDFTDVSDLIAWLEANLASS